MDEKIEVRYIPEDNVKELTELYNKFISQYKIRLTKGGLVVKERNNHSGIVISPEEGEIYGVISLKPASELEIVLKENDLKYEFLLFETKDSKYILVNYTNKYI